MKQRFESKRDRWIVFILWGTVLVLLLAAIDLARAPLPPLERYGGAGICLLSGGLIVWLMRTTYYEVDERNLHVHAGPFRWRIALVDITGVEPTRSAWSSPAMSLDRLRINYGRRRWILVSPERADAFIEALGVEID